MTVPPINPSISEESDDMDGSLPPEEDMYRRKYQLLLERCEVLQQDNERIVHRIYQVKRLTKKYKKEIKFLMNRLDMHGDAFRNVKIEEDVKPNISSLQPFPGYIVPKVEKGVLPTPCRPNDKNSTGNSTGKKPTKRKATKSEKAQKDPNAPKKPCNAFFQFCQEQRPLIIAEGVSDTSTGEPSKQEVTRQLASRWRSLNSEEKKIYVAMFERSKEKYAEEMSAYIKKE